ncbi:MAG TPA: class I SAM-dependent methyltransferase [Terriglobales bacterium]|nr:class I SAM-dependent methyltransferase [Terriglobales bacterium]
MADDLKDYYRRRAASYEAIYQRPDAERLTEQEDLARAIRRHLADRDVLEVAAGTGWWTVQAAAVARHVMATDANPETLDIARLKPLPPSRVTLQTADAYDLAALGRRFDGALCCCWLSHVPRYDLQRFIDGLHSVLKPGAAVFFADNCYVPGQGGELVTPADEADTYKLRQLDDGGTHRILKNYYERDELLRLFSPRADDLLIHTGKHFWWLSYYLAR